MKSPIIRSWLIDFLKIRWRVPFFYCFDCCAKTTKKAISTFLKKGQKGSPKGAT
jgi:hypothetical protein